jgi:hypothetical protein
MGMSTTQIDMATDAEACAESPRAMTVPHRIEGAVMGTLIGFREDGSVPLVVFPGQPGSVAASAGTTVDVHGSHIGRQVVLVFVGGDPRQPLIVGVLRTGRSWSANEPAREIEVDADGERLMVSAKEQLVLRCGKASITLTKAGKVLIEGAYVSNRSSGVMRIKGGAVQIN